MPGVSRKPLDMPDEQPPLGQEVTVDHVDVRRLRVKRACVFIDFGESIDEAHVG